MSLRVQERMEEEEGEGKISREGEGEKEMKEEEGELIQRVIQASTVALDWLMVT